VISQSLHTFSIQGTCSPGQDRLAVDWPTKYDAGNATPHGEIEAGAFVPAVFVQAAAGGGTEWATLPPIKARLGRGPCPVGSIYSVASRECVSCFPSQYGMPQ